MEHKNSRSRYFLSLLRIGVDARLFLRIHRCKDKYYESCHLIGLVIHLISYDIILRFLHPTRRQLQFVWNIVLEGRWIMCTNKSKNVEDEQANVYLGRLRMVFLVD